MTAIEVQRLVDEMLAPGRLNLADIVPDAGGWADAVEKLGTSTHDTRYMPPIGRSRNDYVMRRLGHIVANPHAEDNTEVLIRSYVCASEASADDSSIDEDYINKSPKHIADFVADLVYRAREARRLLFEKDAIDSPDRSRVWAPELHLLVHGHRGCGKTFLLNHILSKFSPDFDKDKILWVRIGLAQEFGTDLSKDFKFNLPHHIYAQLTKIVLRYYDPSSWFYRGKPYPLSLMGAMHEFIDKEAPDGDTKRRWTDSLVKMKRQFQTKGRDPAINPGLVPELLAQEVFHLVLENGYSVICVLDGLDQLEHSASQRSRFVKLFDAAEGLASASGNTGFVLVSVTRTNTFNTLPDLASRPNSYVAEDRTVKRVYPVDIGSIVTRRIEFLRDHVRKVAPSEGWLLDDWPAHLDRFAEFLSTSQDESLDGVSLSMFGDDRREQVHVIQLRYYDFLEMQRLPRYLFVESLVLCQRKFPPRPYRLSMTPAGNWRTEFLGETWYDHHLLPSVFSFPYVEWTLESEHPPPVPHSHGPLWGLRLLQIIAACERLHSAPGLGIDHMTAKECAKMLDALFSYPPDLTVELIDRFKEFELIGLHGRAFLFSPTTQRLQLRLKPKGVYVLRRFLYAVAYLHLTAMRLPLKGDIHDRDCYFVAAALDVPTVPTPARGPRVSDALTRWVSAKIINACAMWRLFATINALQKGQYTSRVDTLEPRLRQIARAAERGEEGGIDGMFEFTDTLKAQLVPQIRGIIQSMEEEKAGVTDRIQGLIKAYWSRWGRGAKSLGTRAAT